MISIPELKEIQNRLPTPLQTPNKEMNKLMTFSVNLTPVNNNIQKTKLLKKTTPKSLQLKRPKNKIKKILKKCRKKGCNCSKSKCLRLHCICFRDGIFCDDTCGCKGCFNTSKNAKLVNDVRLATKDINSKAFKSRVIEFD